MVDADQENDYDINLDAGVPRNEGESWGDLAERRRARADGGGDVHEIALSNVRDALAALNKIPATALNEAKHEQIRSAAEETEAVERSLANELDQMRGDDG